VGAAAAAWNADFIGVLVSSASDLWVGLRVVLAAPKLPLRLLFFAEFE
jgi:hypothetical protein